jgi:predicted molibdopterin-dependent oxidoreductase YjgC
MITLKINDQDVKVEEGTTVLKAAAQAGIILPTLCNHSDLTPYGGCRLCNVEVKGARMPLAACTLPASEGMEVITHNEDLEDSRKSVLELLLSNYYDDNVQSNGENDLIRLARHYQVDIDKYVRKTPRYEIDSDPNPVIFVDLNKCILCSRCVRACAEIQGRFVWGVAERGLESKITAGAGSLMLDARCESCGACAAYCPTGALSDRTKVNLGHLTETTKVRTTCSYCGVGCNFDLNVHEDKVVRVTSAEDAPVNGMALCVKGRYGYDYIHHSDRLTRPLVRAELLDDVKGRIASGDWKIADFQSNTSKGQTASISNLDTFIQTDWETALDVTAHKFAEAKKQHGPDAFAVLASAKCTNEENYLFNKFTRQILATNTIDHCARL